MMGRMFGKQNFIQRIRIAGLRNIFWIYYENKALDWVAQKMRHLILRKKRGEK